MERKYQINCKAEGHTEIHNKKWQIPTEEDAENDEDKLKIYERNSKAWCLLIINLIYIPFGLVRKCD